MIGTLPRHKPISSIYTTSFVRCTGARGKHQHRIIGTCHDLIEDLLGGQIVTINLHAMPKGCKKLIDQVISKWSKLSNRKMVLAMSGLLVHLCRLRGLGSNCSQCGAVLPVQWHLIPQRLYREFHQLLPVVWNQTLHRRRLAHTQCHFYKR